MTNLPKEVSAAFVAAQAELNPASFDSTNPFLKNKYASLGAVIQSSRPVLAKHKLAVLQVPVIDDQSVTVDTWIVHTSGETISGGTMNMSIGEEKGKSRAQAAGSILTYFKRYAWATCLGIYADEDTDGNGPESHANGPRTHSEPKKVAEPVVHVPNAPKAESSATAAHRMRALNLLQAAPGQPNRPLIEHFLRVKGWIGQQQACEDWALVNVPASKEQMVALQEEIARFEDAMRSTPEDGEKII